MKKIYILLTVVMVGVIILASTNRYASVREGFISGSLEIKSISALTFGPDGILFIGDSKSASVFALDTKDNQKVEKAAAVEMKQFDQKVAAALGTEQPAAACAGNDKTPSSYSPSAFYRHCRVLQRLYGRSGPTL